MNRQQRRAAKGKNTQSVPVSHPGIQDLYHEALQHYQAGRLTDAQQAFRRILALDPRHAESSQQLGIMAYQTANTLLAQGKAAEAVMEYRQSLALHPRYFYAYDGLGTALNHLRHYEEAIASYKQAVTLEPRFAAAHNNMGSVLKEQGRLDEALSCFEQAIALQPDTIYTLYNLGAAYNDKGDAEKAAVHFSRYLQLHPADSHGVAMLLAKMGIGALPQRASAAHMQKLYAERAGAWGRDSSQYRGHEIVAELFHKLWDTSLCDVMDVGCGTGMVGALLRPRARRLEGVDFSAQMLQKAQAVGVYDGLYQGDLVELLLQKPQHYDVITCAATLIHFGDLNPALHAIATALRPNGLFIATLFPNDEENDADGVAVASYGGLASGGCYTHGRNYLKRIAAEHGFTVEVLDAQIHEYHQNEPITCLAVALRR